MIQKPDYSRQYAQYVAMVEQALPGCIPQGDCPQKQVEEAMAYSLLGGGKRLRGVLALAACQLFGEKPGAAVSFACALEMVHAYSLIHDDLPCMDNDDLRRGKPTSHKVYGEAMAVLAGDALLTHAFQVVLTAPLSNSQLVAASGILATAAGTRGMLGGQTIDLQSEGKEIPPQLLDRMHLLKTGALIRAAVALGCCAAGVGENEASAMDRFAVQLGLLFQITDDLLDVTSTTQELGKSIGSDAKAGKTTYVTLYGLEGARLAAASIAWEAKVALERLEVNTDFLKQLVDHTLTRTK